MNRKKIDNRIRVLIENGVQTKQRSMFFIVGNQCRNQVPILHHMLNHDARVSRRDVLWCYKKDLGFSSHRCRKKGHLEKMIKSGTLNLKDPDPFELFITSTKICYRYYNKTHTILGNTYGMCILQDFESLTPNLLARTIETVEGSGIIVFLLRSMQSLRQIYSMTMDVHSRYRTESHSDVVGRFNERFLLSLASCENCLVLNDDLQVLPISSHLRKIEPLPPKTASDTMTKSEKDLKMLKESFDEQPQVQAIVNCCKTFDQAKALINFIHVYVDEEKRNWNQTIAMTAARGRGKSATLGLAIATAVAHEYSNIFVTAPSPENLKTLFEFVLKGFDALNYQEAYDYELVQSTNPEFNQAVVRININRNQNQHRQIIQYIHPTDVNKLSSCELLVIDEAAAIPLPLVQKLIGSHDSSCRYITFLSSTINGYEGTGRSLSLKLIKDMKKKSSSPNGRKLTEVTLNESVRYASGDPIEAWLNRLLCLECTTSFNSYKAGFYSPDKCELFYVNRTTLFSYHKSSEAFLQTLMSLYVSSHYKNSPNDLQMLSDAPAHHIFCLVPPITSEQDNLPEVLCVIQVCLEGRISRSSVDSNVSRGKRAAGDLIPWTVSEQFNAYDFPQLCGARIVRIATHPDYQGMGYGKQALKMLIKYFEGETAGVDEDKETCMETSSNEVSDNVNLLNEEIAPRANLPPLLWKLTERRAEKLDYLGVSYGLTHQLFRFWQTSGFRPVYLCQRPNDLTGEHSCVMIRALSSSEYEQNWQNSYFEDFSRRFLDLLGFEFSALKSTTALQILLKKKSDEKKKPLSKEELNFLFTPRDLQRLEKYGKDATVYRLILDLVPNLAKLFFSERLSVTLTTDQKAILLAIGLQHKTVTQVAQELTIENKDYPDKQVLAQLKRLVRTISNCLNKLYEQTVAEEMGLPSTEVADKIVREPIDKNLEEELQEAAAANEEAKKHVEDVLINSDLKKYQISGDDSEWNKILENGNNLNIVSIKSNKRPAEALTTDNASDGKKNKKKKLNGNKQKKKKKAQS